MWTMPEIPRQSGVISDMETGITVLISGIVAGIVQIGKQFGCEKGTGLLLALVSSILMVLLYGLSHETHFERIMLWNYATAIVAVAGTAVGMHSATKNTMEIVQAKQALAADPRPTMTGTGGGE